MPSRAQTAADFYSRELFGMDFYGVVSGPDRSVNESEVLKAIDEWPITYTTLRDRELVLTEAFEVDASPTIVIVEPDGTIVYRANVPPREWPE